MESHFRRPKADRQAYHVGDSHAMAIQQVVAQECREGIHRQGERAYGQPLGQAREHEHNPEGEKEQRMRIVPWITVIPHSFIFHVIVRHVPCRDPSP